MGLFDSSSPFSALGSVSFSSIGGQGDKTWPPPQIRAYADTVEFHRALRDSDENALREMARWKNLGGQFGLPYRIVPLPMRIARASAALLFGERPIITTSSPSDQKRFDEIRRLTNLDAKLRQGAVTTSSEGLCWAKVNKDPSTPKGKLAPKISFLPYLCGIPTWVGDELVQIDLLVDHWSSVTVPALNSGQVLRLFESHTAGNIEYQAWLGRADEQGSIVPLDRYPVTAPYAEPGMGGPTGVPELLVIPWPNASTINGTAISDLFGLEDLFLALNDAFTTSTEAYHIMLPMVLASEEVLDKNGNLPQGLNVIKYRGDMQELGSAKATPISVVQGEFNSTNFESWQDYITRLCLTLSGTSEQMLGLAQGGTVASGTALRLRMAASLMEAAGKAEYARTMMEQLLRLVALVDGVEVEGCQTVVWADADTPPEVQLRDGIPDDPMEAAARIASLPELALQDKFTEMFPGKSENEILAMVARAEAQQAKTIQQDEQAMQAGLIQTIGAAIPGLPVPLALSASKAEDAATDDGD